MPNSSGSTKAKCASISAESHIPERKRQKKSRRPSKESPPTSVPQHFNDRSRQAEKRNVQPWNTNTQAHAVMRGPVAFIIKPCLLLFQTKLRNLLPKKPQKIETIYPILARKIVANSSPYPPSIRRIHLARKEIRPPLLSNLIHSMPYTRCFFTRRHKLAFIALFIHFEGRNDVAAVKRRVLL